MTNAEKFKTVEERAMAFRRFCTGNICKGIGANCIFSDKIHDLYGHKCEFAWLDIEYKEELKKCPFCGGEAEILNDVKYFAKCTKCGANTEGFENDSDAIDAWNRRFG